MTTKVALSEEARVLVGRIADDIEHNGHSPHDFDTRLHSCCVTTSPSWQEEERRGGLLPGRVLDEVIVHFGSLGKIWEWNDHTPTEDVLARLRSISRGEL